MPAERKLTFPRAMMLAGFILVVPLLLLSTAFIAPADREVSGDTTTPPGAAAGSQGQTIFEQKCAGCHTIGGGRGVGPDLKGVTELRDRDWLIQFISAPEQLVAREDPLARRLVQEYGMTMPNLGLSAGEVAEVLAYIEARSGDSPAVPSPTQDREESSTAAQGDASLGKDIFTGRTALQGDGVACLSCHNIAGISSPGGGTMAKELTSAYATFGEPGLTALLQTPPFPIMREIYRERPLTDYEIAQLVAFLQESSDRSEDTSSTSPAFFFAMSALGFLVVLGVLQLIWRRRLSGVRRPLVKGGSR